MLDEIPFVAVRINWNGTALKLPPLPGFVELHVQPEGGFPFGRKGRALIAAWRSFAYDLDKNLVSRGMIILDGDMAVDLDDIAAMHSDIADNPDAVWVSLYKIYPKSTGIRNWVFSVGCKVFSQEVPFFIDRFGFGFTYLPAALILECEKNGLGGWCYPDVDKNVSRICATMDIAVNLSSAQPKHCNY